jgi:hypothetical protein
LQVDVLDKDQKKIGDGWHYGADVINKSMEEVIDLKDNKYKDVRYLRITSESSNGYDITSLSVHRRRYCRITDNKTSLSFTTTANSTSDAQSINVQYANYPLEVECSNPKFKFTPTTSFGDCGVYGMQTVSVTYEAGASAGEDSGELYIKDNTGETLHTITLSATINKSSQTITSHNVASSYKTTDVITLAPTASSGLSNFVYRVSDNTVAQVNGSTLTFLKSGYFDITIKEPGNAGIDSTKVTISNIEVNKVTPTITTQPTIATITLPAILDTVTIGSVYEAEDDKGTAVTGTFTWNGTQTKMLDGTHNYSITFTPDQPAGKDWYNDTTYNIAVTAVKGAQTIDWSSFPNASSQACSKATSFNATASSGLAVTFTTSDKEIATIVNNTELNVLKAGTVTIYADQEGDDDYAAAPRVSKTITLTKEKPVIATMPTADTIYVSQTLSASTLHDWSVTVNDEPLSGSFAWNNSAILPAEGKRSYKATFTGTPAAWYDTVQADVEIVCRRYPQVVTWAYEGGTINVNANVSFSGATSSVEQPIHYLTSDPSIAEVDEEHGNKLIVHGKGTIEVIARPEENAIYEATEQRRTLTILPLVTTVMANPAAAEDLTYGQALSATEVVGGTVKGSDNAELQGTWTWDDGTEELNAGQNQSRGVTFTPTDDHWYTTATATATVNVNKANPTLAWSVAPTNLAYNGTATYTATSASNGAITYAIVEGGSYASIDENTGVLSIIEPGYTVTVQASQAEAANYNAPEAITVDVVIAAAPVNEFTNANGDGDWTNPANWSGNAVPEEDAPIVIVSGELVISDTLTVSDLTIEKDGGVTIVDDGKLIVTGESKDRVEYGDIHVMDDGELELKSTARLEVRHFTLDAKLGNTTNAAASGQISNEEKLNVNGDVYFQMTFEPNGAVTYGWYDFVVPFEVEVVGGIYEPSNLTTPLTNGWDYAVMAYDESKRAVKGKDWNKFSGTMLPGRVYTITIDYTRGWKSLVFKKKAGAAIGGSDAYQAEYSSALGESLDRGWNGLGNGTLRHTKLAAENVIIQIYDHANKCYVPREADSVNLAVGTSFFMQVGSAQTIVMNDAASNRPLLAPSVNGRHRVENFRLALVADGADYADDRTWLSASEEATGEYVVGRDVLKMGSLTGTNIARLWTRRADMNLCSNQMLMNNDESNCELGLYAPKAQAYTLSIENGPEDTDLYLTYNDRIIWDLTASPYTFDLNQGTTTGYGLRMKARAPQVATGVDEQNAEGQAMRKVIIDNTVYVITPDGKMYDIVGKSIK